MHALFIAASTTAGGIPTLLFLASRLPFSADLPAELVDGRNARAYKPQSSFRVAAPGQSVKYEHEREKKNVLGQQHLHDLLDFSRRVPSFVPSIDDQHQSVDTERDGGTTSAQNGDDMQLFGHGHMQRPGQGDGENEDGQIGDDADSRVGDDDGGSVQTRTVVAVDLPGEGDGDAVEDLDEQNHGVVADEANQEGV
jgi:hypothetical protein